MLFKVRDLLVSVLPGAGGDDCTSDTRCNGCTNQFSDCDGGCSNARSDFSENCPQWRYDPADVEELRTLVAWAAARTEAARIEARLESAAVAELDRVEAQLTRALEAVERDRAELPEGDEAPERPATAFRVADLLISVIPSDVADDASGCPGCTCVAGCSGGATGCTNASTHDEVLDWGQQVVLPELRSVLAATMARLDAGPVPLATAPRSRREADALLASLKSSLEGVAERRAAIEDGRIGRG